MIRKLCRFPYGFATRVIYLTFTTICTFASPPAMANLIDNGTYVTDTSKGIDWLKLTETSNMSFSQVAADITSKGRLSGWRYATTSEFEALLVSQGAEPTQTCFEETLFCGGSPEYRSATQSLLNTLGDTFEQYLYGKTIPDFYGYSIGILAESTSDTQHYAAYVFQDYIYTHQYNPSDDFAERMTGSYLVREALPIPEPATALLLVFGALALLGSIPKRRLV